MMKRDTKLAAALLELIRRLIDEGEDPTVLLDALEVARGHLNGGAPV